MKACLIGYNLTNFILAIVLANKNFKVDIVFEKKIKIKQGNRTIGVSKTNIDFLNSLFKIPKNCLWPIYDIKIYNSKNEHSQFLEFKDRNNENFFLLKQFNLFKITKRKCELLKNVFFKNFTEKKLLKLEKKNDYNFIINSETNNILSKKFFFNKIQKNFNSIAHTSILNHKTTQNHSAIQIFTKLGPLAFLPFSKNKTSVVYSVEKKYKASEIQITNEILKYAQNFKNKKLENFEKYNLKFSFPRKINCKNILCFGEALHKIHPLAGQGFNMTLRDIKLLSNIIDKHLYNGLEVNETIITNFVKKTKHLNYLFGTGINFINSFFKIDKRFEGYLSEKLFIFFNNNPTLIKNSIKIADKGIDSIIE